MRVFFHNTQGKEHLQRSKAPKSRVETLADSHAWQVILDGKIRKLTAISYPLDPPGKLT